MGWDGPEQNGTEHNTTEQNTTEQNATGKVKEVSTGGQEES